MPSFVSHRYDVGPTAPSAQVGSFLLTPYGSFSCPLRPTRLRVLSWILGDMLCGVCERQEAFTRLPAPITASCTPARPDDSAGDSGFGTALTPKQVCRRKPAYVTLTIRTGPISHRLTRLVSAVLYQPREETYPAFKPSHHPRSRYQAYHLYSPHPPRSHPR